MSNPARLLRYAAVGMLALNLVGCASIVHGGRRPVAIDSDPQGALVTIKNSDGRIVATQATPFTAKLSPEDSYFHGMEYTATFELTGYAHAEAYITPQLSPWYFGNIVFGGIIGFVIVDPLTGDMWNLRPLHIEQTLIKLPEPLPSVPPPTSASPPPTPPPVALPESTNSPASSPSASDATNSPAPPLPTPAPETTPPTIAPPSAPPEIINPPAPPPSLSDSTNSPAQPPPSTP